MALGTVSLRCLLNCSYISQHETNSNNVTNKGHKLIVYVGSMPLRAPPGIGQWAISSADNLLHSTNLRHFYTILASSSGTTNPVKTYHGLFYSLIIIQQASNLRGDDALDFYLFLFPFILYFLWCSLQYVAFDFQPRNPEDPYTAFIALSGAAIPGIASFFFIISFSSFLHYTQMSFRRRLI